jgi:predicted dienelactone hydrolase
MACQAPPEFGDLRAKATALADSDEVFHAALANDSRSYRDQRVCAVFAMAPACGATFVPESLERIDIPVAIVAGAAEAIVRSAAAQEPTPRISRMPS